MSSLYQEQRTVDIHQICPKVTVDSPSSGMSEVGLHCSSYLIYNIAIAAIASAPSKGCLRELIPVTVILNPGFGVWEIHGWRFCRFSVNCTSLCSPTQPGSITRFNAAHISFFVNCEMIERDFWGSGFLCLACLTKASLKARSAQASPPFHIT